MAGAWAFSSKVPTLVALVSTLLVFSSEGSSLKALPHTSNPTPISLKDFEDCQRSYCERLVKFFNTPIEWRLVLDVSKSYVNPFDTALQKLSTVIAELPIAEGDTFCLDTFDVNYRRGECISEMDEESIQRVTIPNDELHNMLKRRLPPEESETRRVTDFQRALRSIKGFDTSLDEGIRCGLNPLRRYYILLTDGKHDPDDSGFQPLFSEPETEPSFATTATEFVTPQLRSRSCENLGQLIRGLHFIVDATVAPELVQDNWRDGQEFLRGLDKAPRPTQNRFFRPGITVWDFSQEPPAFFKTALKKQVDRVSGAYPCILQNHDPEMKLTSHHHPYPEFPPEDLPDTCSLLAASDYKVSLPASLLALGRGKIHLPFFALQLGPDTESLQLTLTSEESPSTDDPETWPLLRTTKGPLDKWTSQRLSFDLPLQGSNLSQQTLPARADFTFGHNGSQLPILTLKLDRGTYLEYIDSFLRRPGIFPIILATGCLVLAWLSFSRAEEAGLSLMLAQKKSFRASTEDIPLPDEIPLTRNGTRFVLDDHGEIVDNERDRPYQRPSVDDFDHDLDATTFLDIIPVGSVIYCLRWLRSGSFVNQGKPLVRRNNVYGDVLVPKTTWVPCSEANGQSQEGLIQRLFPNRLRWPKDLELKRQPFNGATPRGGSFEVFLFVHDTKRRAFQAVFRALAFSAALVAAIHVWWPRAYASILSSTLLGEWSKHVGCLQMILAVFVSLFLLRFWSAFRSSMWTAELVFWTGRVSTIGFWFLFISTWGSLTLPDGATWEISCLSLSLALSILPFLFVNRWVCKRIEAEKSFWIGDLILDSLLTLAPIAH